GGGDGERARWRSGAEGRTGQEDEQAGEEDALATDDVGELARRDEHSRIDDRVGAEDPGEIRQARRGEAVLDRRERDGDDEEVENREEDANREDAEGAPWRGCLGGLAQSSLLRRARPGIREAA